MNKPWVEHVAIRVRDLEWHLAFFRDALGMEITEVQGDAARPAQVWIGGIQLTRDDAFAPRPNAEERAWHIGIHIADIDAALSRVKAYHRVKAYSDDANQQNWFILPDGLVIELVNKSYIFERISL